MSSKPIPSRYRQGRIVWAWLRSGSGKKEKHPAVIISAHRDIIQPEQFDPRKDPTRVNAVAVVGISTEYRKYPPFIVMPYSKAPGGHPITKLNQDCAACIGWYDWVSLEDDVIALGGDLPKAEMDLLLGAIVGDLKRKLPIHADRLTKQLLECYQLIEALIGKP